MVVAMVAEAAAVATMVVGVVVTAAGHRTITAVVHTMGAVPPQPIAHATKVQMMTPMMTATSITSAAKALTAQGDTKG